ncbi:MAG: SCO family protein [Cyclonatronaceae bacterium]
MSNPQTQGMTPDELEENQALMEQLQIQEQLGEYIPADITLINEAGEEVPISSYFESGKPVLLNLVYYNCPSMCSLILNGVADVVDKLRWNPSEEYEILTVSIDPSEGHEFAAQQKASYISQINRSGMEEGWHFMTASQESIDRLQEAIGQPFIWSDEAQEFLHSSAIAFISPERKITRYLYGVSYRELDVRNALFDASGGKVGSTMERIAMYCFTYDADSRSYVPYAMNIMKIGGLVILGGLGLFLGFFWLKERGKTSKDVNFDV